MLRFSIKAVQAKNVRGRKVPGKFFGRFAHIEEILARTHTTFPTEEEAEAAVLNALRSMDSDLRKRHIIVCNDGHVLSVHWVGLFNGYAYAIVDPSSTRNYSSSVQCAADKTFGDCCAMARSHAEQSYGGVKYESSC